MNLRPWNPCIGPWKQLSDDRGKHEGARCWQTSASPDAQGTRDAVQQNGIRKTERAGNPSSCNPPAAVSSSWGGGWSSIEVIGRPSRFCGEERRTKLGQIFCYQLLIWPFGHQLLGREVHSTYRVHKGWWAWVVDVPSFHRLRNKANDWYST